MSSGLSDAKVTQVSLPVRDLQRAVRFYREVLGLKLVAQEGELAFFDLANTQLILQGGVGEAPVPTDTPALTFQADGLPWIGDALETRGVSFDGEPDVLEARKGGELQLLTFSDPDGNLLGLTGWVDVERRPKAHGLFRR